MTAPAKDENALVNRKSSEASDSQDDLPIWWESSIGSNLDLAEQREASMDSKGTSRAAVSDADMIPRRRLSSSGSNNSGVNPPLRIRTISTVDGEFKVLPLLHFFTSPSTLSLPPSRGSLLSHWVNVIVDRFY